MHTWFHFTPSWVIGSLTICLILSTNKTRAGGLLRQCNPTLKWVEHHELRTHVSSQIYTRPNVCSPKRNPLPIEYIHWTNSCILKKALSCAGFHKSNQAPIQSFCLSFLSGSNLPTCPQAKSWRQQVWKAMFAQEWHTLLLKTRCSPGGDCNLEPPGVLRLHPLWWWLPIVCSIGLCLNRSTALATVLKRCKKLGIKTE